MRALEVGTMLDAKFQITGRDGSLMTHELSNLTWWEADERFKESRLVIVPVGSMEQHGLHLGMGSDWIQAWNIAKRVSDECGVLLLPVQPYGVSGHHKEFPGVITLESDTLQKLVYDILRSLDRYGVNRVVFMNGHGGNMGAITEAIKRARDDFEMICAIVHWWDVLKSKSFHGHPAEEHAGYAETAFMLASRPEAVRMDKAVLTPTKQVDDEIQLIRAGLARFKNGLVRIPLKTVDVSVTGSMTEAHPEDVPGTKDYSMITSNYAENLMEEVVAWMCDFVKRFEKFQVLDEKVTRARAFNELE